MLTLVPTPIGNLQDITLRAINVLKQVDTIICEDSRRTGILLKEFDIKKPILVLNDFNEYKMVPNILERLQAGQDLALVSDAGTPLISDPGYKLVREAISSGIKVDSLPGANSVTTALTLSTLPPDKFMFLGYMPDKPGHRQKLMDQIIGIHELIPTTFIIFLPPFKIIKTLQELQIKFGDIEIVLAKELTKIYQSVEKQPLTYFLEKFEKNAPKGEFVGLFRLG